MRNIIEKYENGTLVIGEVVSREYQIKNFSADWMDFSDHQKVSLLKEAVKEDVRFSDIVEFVRDKNELNVGEVIPEFVEAMENLSAIERFVGYIYCQLCCELYTIDTNRPFITSPKRMKVYLGGRIGDHNQNETYHVIANNFGLGMSSWDGETAVKDPTRVGSSCWDINYRKIAQHLIEKEIDCQALIEEQEKVKNILTKLLEIDQKLVELKKKTGLRDEELKEYFSVKNLHASFFEIWEAVEVLVGHTFHKEGIYTEVNQTSSVEGDKLMYIPFNTEHINTPGDSWRYMMGSVNRLEDARPSKKYSSEVSVVKDGQYIGQIILPAYFIYEDFVGGRSIWNKEFQIKEVVDINVDDSEVTIIYIDGDGERREVKINK